MKLRISLHAGAAVKEVFERIAEDDKRAAGKWLMGLDRVLQQVRTHPESGRVVPEFEQEDIREVLCGPYRVLYVHERNRLTVVSVVHGARLLEFERDIQPALDEV